MNTQCLNCTNIRMIARLQGGCATPMFQCLFQKVQRTHLMPGPKLKCLVQRDSNTISQDILDPEIKAT